LIVLQCKILMNRIIFILVVGTCMIVALSSRIFAFMPGIGMAWFAR
jgi:hypothetical protein